MLLILPKICCFTGNTFRKPFEMPENMHGIGFYSVHAENDIQTVLYFMEYKPCLAIYCTTPSGTRYQTGSNLEAR
ncbi:hypothetical protein GA0061077_0386 [Bifidobacterium commune]|uniref:Uncharacterized protein n=1 Tax=Bifidobacterium commune TaxID=1505727 RepID=A0A1C4H1D3_9BIFI|nr:hypothetical protein GA0061077_0386 [Bifidobacterium commune]